MPIKPENKKRYPPNWKTEIRPMILKRADNRCEFCGIENYTTRDNGSRVILTIAHLDHTPENCDPENLRALCQKCHNNYDKEHRAETRKKTRQWQIDGQLSFVAADGGDQAVLGERRTINKKQRRRT